MAAAPSRLASPSAAARAGVVLLGVCWGLNWIAVRFALHEIPPWSLRTLGIGLGALVLFAWALARGRSLHVEPGRARRRLAWAGLLNIAAFGVFSAFAQLSGATSRVAMVTFTMPIWSVLIARVAIGERLDVARRTAVAFAGAGLALLIAPLFADGTAAGAGWALLAALAWAGGTVYLKAARIDADPIAIAAWQLAAGFVAVAAGALLFEGLPRDWPRAAATGWAVLYHVLLGTALPYLLWCAIVGRLPASSAALGTLLVPVVAVLGAIVLLGERPGALDAAGFALVFAAAAAVLLRVSPAPAPAAPDPRSGDPR